ncbi:tetratricopeptide repeat protein [Laspinema sp. D1]|uniref:tetratricopeptide repeat protein n=1 Tax=Laspinema palackyanum TaxID=3231601 RepID=UPI003491CCAF|nr:tetratricopeptide repeat protein [Laspinema sp. D2b]
MPFSHKPLNLALLTLILFLGIPTLGESQRNLSHLSVTAQTVEELKEEARRLLDLGIEQYQRSQIRDALQSWEQALEIYRQLGDIAGEGGTLYNLGNVYYSLGEYAQAQQYLLQSLEISLHVGDKAWEGRNLNDLGSVYSALGEYAQAQQYLLQSLEISLQLGDKAREGVTLYNLGKVYNSLGEYAQAQQYLRQSLEIFRQLGNKAGEGNTLLNLGIVYGSLGEYAQAQQYLRQSLEIFQQLGDKAEEGRSLDGLGNVYNSLGEYAQAQQYLRQSLEIFQQLADKAGEGRSLNGLGSVYSALGEYAQAQQYLLQSLEISRQLGDKAGEGMTLNNLGDVYGSLGEYAQAQQYLLQSLEISRQLGNKAGEGNTLYSLGNVDYSLGEYAQAQQYLLQSLEISRQIGDKSREGNTLNNLGNVDYSLGEYAQAQQYLLQSLEISRQIGDKAGEGITLNNLGNVDYSLGEYAQAEQYYRQSLEISRQIGDKSREGITLNNLGSVSTSLGEYVQAQQFHRQSLEIFQQIGDKAREGITLGNLGNVYNSLGEYAQAEQFYRQSIEVREQLRPGLTDQQKISLFEQQKSTYELLQTVLIAQNKLDAALEISERGRARAFVELLADRLWDNRETPVTVTPPNLREIQQIAAAQQATIVQYSYIREDFTFGNVERLWESELYIWVIKPTGEITFRRTDLKPLWQQQDSSLAKAIADARCFDNLACLNNITVSQIQEGSTEVRSGGGLFNQQAQQEQARPVSQGENRELKQLYQLLIEPIADLLPTNPTERVIFVPHNALFLVPFPALQDARGQYLIEKHTILTAPSIQVLGLTRDQKQAQTAVNPDILVVGNPTMPVVGTEQLTPLPGAEQEAREIGQLLNVTPLIGSMATKATVVQKMQSSRIIHLATHGSFDPNIPLDSWLALTPSGADNGLLTAAEIFGLNLNAELVVLSACDTGRGKITGDGVIGLSRSFISAGVPSVLVSLWKVPDDSTALLMREFYQLWEESGDKGQALRQAMLTTMQQYPNPVDWAAFTLMGEAE